MLMFMMRCYDRHSGVHIGSDIVMHEPLGMRAKAGCVIVDYTLQEMQDMEPMQCVDESFPSIHSTSLLYCYHIIVLQIMEACSVSHTAIHYCCRILLWCSPMSRCRSLAICRSRAAG